MNGAVADGTFCEGDVSTLHHIPTGKPSNRLGSIPDYVYIVGRLRLANGVDVRHIVDCLCPKCCAEREGQKNE